MKEVLREIVEYDEIQQEYYVTDAEIYEKV